MGRRRVGDPSSRTRRRCSTQANELRYRVLHEPFGVERDDDWNDEDPASAHLVALVGDEVVGYARLIADAEARTRPDPAGRGLARSGSAGGSARRSSARCSTARAVAGMNDVWLNARLTAVPFYEKLGFRVTSGVFRIAAHVPAARADGPRALTGRGLCARPVRLAYPVNA